MTTTPDWRQFEELVARIEAIASPRAASVRSPDRVRDIVTGQMREVDASIRYRVGTVDILITIECRKRGRRADDTWIEQLATKRAKIGAAKTIAVSAAGFSDSAHRTAAQHGIELRTLSEVTPGDLQNWFLPTGVVHVFRKVEQIECVVYLECTDGGPTDYGLKAADEFEPIFFHDKIKSPFPAATLFHLVEMMEEEKFWTLPFDGTLTEVGFKINGRGVLSVKGTENRLAVHHVRLSAKVGYEVADLSLQDGKHHRYVAPDGSEVQHTTFEAQLFGLPFEFEHQADSQGSNHAAFCVRKRPTGSKDA
jgi:hypothetical protein